MDSFNSKAYYLNSFLKHRSKSEPKPRQNNHIPPIKLSITKRVSCIKSRTNQSFPLKQQQVNMSIVNANQSFQYKYKPLQQKQRKILIQLEKGKRDKSKINNCHSLSNVNKRGNSMIKSVEMESMKATDRYFKEMQNIRLAENILLMKPSKEIRKDSLNKFYQQHTIYKMNISKLSYKNQECKKDKAVRLHRKKWID